MSRRLRPVTSDVPAPEARTVTTHVPAPPEWERRAGEADVEWEMNGLAWGERTDRPVVVLVHGLIVAARMVGPTAERLARDGLVLAPDLPGCGRSDKPRPVPDIGELGGSLAGWIDRLGEPDPGDRLVLVGNSLGAQVALDTALRLGERVAGVVLVSPVVQRDRRRWRTQIGLWMRERRTQTRRLRRITNLDIIRGGPIRLVRTFAASLRDRPEERVRTLAAPVLVCHGTRDPLIEPDWCALLAERAPYGQMISLPGAVHAMAHDDPLEVSRAVTAFIDDLESPTTARRQAG